MSHRHRLKMLQISRQMPGHLIVFANDPIVSHGGDEIYGWHVKNTFVRYFVLMGAMLPLTHSTNQVMTTNEAIFRLMSAHYR